MEYLVSMNYPVLREAAKKKYFLNGHAIKASPPPPPSLMAVRFFLSVFSHKIAGNGFCQLLFFPPLLYLKRYFFLNCKAFFDLSAMNTKINQLDHSNSYKLYKLNLWTTLLFNF